MRICRLLIFLGLYFNATSYAAFEFTLNDLSGRSHKLADYRGKWVLVNFWATWCPPCLAEMPELSTLHDENDNIVVLGINFWEKDLDRIKEFVEGLLIEFPILTLPDPQDVKGIGKISSLPTSVLVSPEGKAVGILIGIIDVKKIQKFIEQNN